MFEEIEGNVFVTSDTWAFKQSSDISEMGVHSEGTFSFFWCSEGYIEINKFITNKLHCR